MLVIRHGYQVTEVCMLVIRHGYQITEVYMLVTHQGYQTFLKWTSGLLCDLTLEQSKLNHTINHSWSHEKYIQ